MVFSPKVLSLNRARDPTFEYTYLADHPSIYKPFGPFGSGAEQPQLGDLLAIVANQLLTGMILQVHVVLEKGYLFRSIWVIDGETFL